MKTDILIVGGGLSGLYLASLLQKSGVDFCVVEARKRWGGRILSREFKVAGKSAAVDLGPAWFWPGQPRMARLLADFGIEPFLQYSTGDFVYEDENQNVQTGSGFAPMEGSLRLDGGFERLTDALVASLPANRLFYNQPVVGLRADGNFITANTRNVDDVSETIEARTVVLAVPPRVAAETIQFEPHLPDGAISAMRGISTWMAGHAKIVAVYEHPFWREAGLSGDAMSRRGPMMEIHDASPGSGGPYALFGFVGYPAHIRAENQEMVLEHAGAQLVRLFGSKAVNPKEIYLQDWAQERFTATSLDHVSSNAHPIYGLPDELCDLWDGRITMGSTETAPQFGGFLEGALEAAEIVFEKITRRTSA